MTTKLAPIRVGAPLLSLSVAATGGVLLGHEVWWWGVLFAFLAFCFSPRRVLWFSFIVVMMGLMWWRALDLEGEREGFEKWVGEGRRWVEGEVRVGGRVDPGGWSEERRAVFWREGGGRCEVVLLDNDLKWEAGERWAVKGYLRIPEKKRNPGELDEASFFQRKGLWGSLEVGSRVEVGWSWVSGWLGWTEAAREWVKVAVVRGLASDSTGAVVIQAMVLGDTPSRDSEISRAFRHSGALHVFAVSGLHVTLVGGMVWLVLGWLRVKRRQAVFLVMLGMVGYALLTGGRPPALRAALMGVVVLTGFLVRRRAAMVNALGFCLLVSLLWRPGQIFDLGFQLSYIVLAAISFGVVWCERWIGRMAEVDEFMPRSLLTFRQEKWLSVRKWFAGSLATSLAAWVGSLPMMVWHFGLVAPVSIFASVWLILMTFFVLFLAFVSAVLGALWSPLSVWPNQLNGALAEAAFWSARRFESVPLGHVYLSERPPAEVVVFDLGAGGGCWVDAGGGVLFDSGSRREFGSVVRPALRNWRVEPDSLVLSHPDEHHVGGMVRAVEIFDIEQSLVPVKNAQSPRYREFLGKASALYYGKAGESYELEEGVFLEVIRGGDDGEGWLADDRVMVLRLDWDGWKILFLSDAGLRVTQEMLAMGADLSADVVVMGRNFHGGSGDVGLLRATGAEVVVTSVDDYPVTEGCDDAWVEKVQAMGMVVMRQDVTGAVMFDFEDDEMKVRPFLKGVEEVILKR